VPDLAGFAAANDLVGKPGPVTFNGNSFDLPVLRYRATAP
jgi:predicted PolB exonuclease-like 3'-5' exonuclease